MSGRLLPIASLVLSLRQRAEADTQLRLRLVMAELERQRRATEQAALAHQQLQKKLVALREKQRTYTSAQQLVADQDYLRGVSEQWALAQQRESQHMDRLAQLRTTAEALRHHLAACVSRREAAELHEQQERREQRRLRERKDRAHEEDARDRALQLARGPQKT